MATVPPVTEDEKEAVKTFANARGFQIAAGILDRQSDVVRKLVHFQMLASEVFALELSIKALHRLRGSKPNGHDINALYASLQQGDKDLIAKHYDKLIKQHVAYQWAVTKNIPLDIESVLLRNRDTFIRARYWHEGKNPQSDTEGNISNAGTGTLSDAIRQVILDEYPLWADSNLAKAITPPENSRPTT